MSINYIVHLHHAMPPTTIRYCDVDCQLPTRFTIRIRASAGGYHRLWRSRFVFFPSQNRFTQTATAQTEQTQTAQSERNEKQTQK